tara:strand:- start:768 stop:1181 length:414 start_codon:yes stop_codon:yes gene_type:complete
MASELRVNTLKDASGNNSIDMSFVAEGSAKAWTNFNGTGTIAHRDSFNCGSLTDQGTGEYDISFTTNMGNANYCPTANTNGNSNADNFSSATFVAIGTSNSSMTGNSTSGTSLGSYVSGSGYADAILNFVSVHGDLA